MNTALIIAGGVGSRTGQEIPKQFLTVNEVPVIIYTLKVFQEQSTIDKIVVVCLKGWEEILKAYCRQFGISKLESVVEAGNTRFDSIYNGVADIKEWANDDDLITIHDANRPLVFSDIIERSQKTAAENGSALAVIPCNDSMFISQNRYIAEKNVDRNTLFSGQTPESFRFKIIHDICRKAKKDNAGDLSISALLIKYNYKVFLSEGSSLNLKITTPEDIDIFKALLQIPPTKKVNG